MSSATMKKAMQCCAFVICCFASILLHAQTNTVTIGSKSMNAKAVLWLVPNGGQGLLLPSVTTAVRSGMGLQSADKGMVVFDNQENKLYLWDGTAWIGVSGNSSPVTLSGDVSGVSGNTVVTAIRGKNISTAAPANQQVLKFNSTSNQWEPAADATTSLTAGAGIIITAGQVSVNTGTGANQIVQLDATGKLPAVDGSQLTNLPGGGDITSVIAGVGLTGGAATGAATLNVDVGTTANKIVQLDATGKLPAVDGSQLTNLPGGGDITGVTAGTGLTGGATSGNATLNVDVGTTANKIVQLDATGKLPAVDGSLLTNLAGDISSVVAGTGLTGGATSGAATLNVDVGTTANKIVQLDATGKLPAVDGSQLTNLAGGGDITGVTAGTGLTGGATSGNATLNVDVGTTANKIVQLDATGKLPAVDGSLLTNLAGDISSVVAGTGLTGGATSGAATLNVDVGTTANKIVQLDATGKLPAVDGSQLTNLAGGGDITGVTAGTGLTGGATSGNATLNVDVGTTANKIVQLDATGKLPAVDGSLLTNLAGDISSVVAGTGLTGGATSGAATLNVDVGTTANKIVQLDATGKLPAVDGSQLTNLAGGGDITGVTAGTGLTGGATSGNATLNVDVGTTANKIVQLDATGKLPAVDGSQLTGIGDITAVTAGTGLTGGATTGAATLNVDVGTTANKIVQLDATGKLPAVDGSLLTNLAGDISSVVAGTGLTGGATSGAATLNVDVGTTANKIVQLDASSRLPAVNGSLLTNLPAWSLTGNAGTTAGTNFIGTTDAQALSFKTNNTERVRIDASGNIGLGVSIPRAQLHFSNAPLTRKKLVLFEGGNNDHQFHGFGVDESGALNYSLSNTANDHVFTAAASASASNELLRIKGNGDVGIGTSTPRAPLHLANSIRNKKIVLHETANNEYQFTGLGVNSTTGLSYVSPASTADHIFYSATSASAQKELMRLTGTGFLGIGVTQPHAPLHVTNTVDKRRLIIYEAANNEIQYYGLGLSSLGEMEYRVASAAAANDHVFYAGLSSTTERELMRIDGNGRVGIANTSPGYRLHVMAESPATAYSGTPFQGTALGTPGSGSQLFAIGTDGWIYAQGIVFASDQRIKTNINASTSREDLTTLMQLKVRDYQYKDYLARGKNSHKGFIAQEVKEVYPEAVTSTMKESIPTVYAKAIQVTKTNEGIYSITTPTKHDFELNDRVRLITPQGDVVEDVISIDGPQCFSIRTTRLQSTDDVFVFGKEISDMHIVDYDKIYTLGISAIQELYREIEALKKENEILKAKQTETSRNEVEKLKAEVAEIKRMLGVEASVKER